MRGAPAIGVAAAYGLALAATQGRDLDDAYETLAASRPTAVNLRWALDEMRADPTPERARRIHADEVERCRQMGAHAAALVPPARQDPHALQRRRPRDREATARPWGRFARRRSGEGSLTSGSTRRARCFRELALTAFELEALGIPHAVIVDGAAASRMAPARSTS